MSISILFTWDGDAMIPYGRFKRDADRQYVVGEKYRLAIEEDRSSNSHRHYFACIRDAWANLPEWLADDFQTPEKLRKFCLIKAGYHDSRSIVCASKAEALRVAAFIKPMDDFAIVDVTEAVVTVYTAKSQSMKSMGGKVFQKSKDDVLGVLEEMLAIPEGSLITSGGMAA